MKYLLAIFTLFSFYSYSTNSVKEVSNFHKVLHKYQTKNSVVMDIDKKFSQPFLKKETQSKGKFYFSKGLWRLELFSPQKTSIFYDGKQIIYKSHKDNVSHYIPSSSDNILATLFDKKIFEQTFKYQKTTEKGRTSIYSFKGISSKAPPQISIQTEKDRILSLLIQLEEPLGEEYYRFSSIEFNRSLSKKLFQEP